MAQLHNDLFDALADEKRRRLLFALVEENPQPDSPIGKDSPPDTTQLEYQHVHLPKLVDYGFIDWTSSESHVEKGPQFEEIRPVLELLTETHTTLSTTP